MTGKSLGKFKRTGRLKVFFILYIGEGKNGSKKISIYRRRGTFCSILSSRVSGKTQVLRGDCKGGRNGGGGKGVHLDAKGVSWLF